MHIAKSSLPLTLDRSTKGTLSLPQFIYARLNKLNHLPNLLSFGSSVVKVNVTSHSSDEKRYLLSANIWEALHIPFEKSVHLYIKDKMIHLGPVVGVFTAGFTNHSHRPIGDRSQLFAQYLSSTTEIGGFYFVFGPHHVNWKDGLITGLFYTDGGWIKHDIPFPHVVYDRIPNRKAEQLPLLQSVKTRMQANYFIPWFNSGFFDKWKIHESLIADELVHTYLPETILHPPISTIEKMLTQYKHIYIKPANGSLGLGILHIIKREKDGHYYCHTHTEKGALLRRYTHLTTLIDTHLPKAKRGSFVVQQGITLMKIDKRPLDFRVHTNKDRHGNWCISALAAKISGPNSVTTHLKNGGKVKTIQELIRENNNFRPYIQKLRKAALELSEAIDKRLDGFNGEIGFDIGIDLDGRIWMFEANSKPGRAIFIHPQLKEAEKVTRILPFEYGIHLAEAAITAPETVIG